MAHSCWFSALTLYDDLQLPTGDWRSSFGFGPGHQAGSLMVAVPPGQQAVHSVAGAGANAASAFILPTVSARGVSDAQMTKWKIAFQNLCALQGLRVVVQEGKPPQRDAVKKTWPDLEGPAVEQKFNECLLEYQRENTVLYITGSTAHSTSRESGRLTTSSLPAGRLFPEICAMAMVYSSGSCPSTTLPRLASRWLCV